ncbi:MULTISPECIES: glycosyltransferase family 4 protein [unclassified Psychrobacter]|uniref:glycosyltransferase family 4 protein n=1 Tax=unclassified Psychrobacter TaxID=196806 RepID=UPI00040F7C3B|nr:MULTISPECIES: glycosyltransferase family 4 protein [unclassified Psychrobacter]
MIKNLEVCIYSPSENIWGGGQIYIENLCRYMNDKGLATVIATSEPDTFSCPTITMDSVASKAKRLSSSLHLAKTLKRSGIKVIVLNDLSSLWLAPMFRLQGFKVVSLLHLYLQKRNAAGLGHSDAEYHLLRFSSRFCDKVFSVNKENLQAFPVEVEFIGNFISPWFFSDSKASKKYDLAIISRLSKEKNIPLFVNLINRLNSQGIQPIKSLILGRGEEKENIISAIEQAGLQDVIDLQDWADRKDLPAIYDSIKCFAITSHHEGFATTLLEAHARGVPAITTKSAGFCAEFVEGFGRATGISFEPKEIDSLEFQQQVLSLIDNAESYHQACIDKAKIFNEDEVLGKIHSYIELIINNK